MEAEILLVLVSDLMMLVMVVLPYIDKKS
jgi:hypothetical protein